MCRRGTKALHDPEELLVSWLVVPQSLHCGLCGFAAFQCARLIMWPVVALVCIVGRIVHRLFKETATF